MKTFPEPLSAEEEKRYIALLEKGDPEARDILIERNLRLVAHIVKKYHQGDRDVEDLLSIGTVGLIKAIDTYRSGKVNKLSTYAARCIENEVLMTLRSERKFRREVSLFEPIGTDKEGNEIHLVDVIEGEESDVVGDIFLDEMIGKLEVSIRDILDERELELLKLRYGLGIQKELTQREVAAKMGISRSYVSRLEKRALETSITLFLKVFLPFYVKKNTLDEYFY